MVSAQICKHNVSHVCLILFQSGSVIGRNVAVSECDGVAGSDDFILCRSWFALLLDDDIALSVLVCLDIHDGGVVRYVGH